MPLLVLPLAADEEAGKKSTVLPVLPGVAVGWGSIPWVGLVVASLDESMRAQVPEVPKGVGFLIDSVALDGPASKAGLQRYDVLWKFEDQMLINEAQFATLLRLKKAGDPVKLSVVRGGESLEVELVLGKAPDDPKSARISPSELPLIPTGVPGMPQVRVTPQERVAEITRADGSLAKLYYKGDEAWVTIQEADMKVIYDGPVRADGEFLAPDDWSCSIGAMFRSLYKAKNPNWAPRRPRPRVVMPADSSER
ncbi:MAG: PDZ domain-containing protein [Haloferula sp.]